MLSGFLFWWLAVLVLASLLGWQVWRARHFRAAAEMREAALIADNATLSEAASRAEAKARQLDGVLAALSDGVSVVDAELRLVGWNPRFPECAGVPRRALRIGISMAEVLRLQAEAGEFGLVDPEAEVAQRMALLRGGFIVPRLRRERPDGTTVELRRAALPGGGFVTVYSPVISTSPPQFQPVWPRPSMPIGDPASRACAPPQLRAMRRRRARCPTRCAASPPMPAGPRLP